MTAISDVTKSDRARIDRSIGRSEQFTESNPGLGDLVTGRIPAIEPITRPIPIVRVANYDASWVAAYSRPSQTTSSRAPLGLRIVVSALFVVMLASIGGLVLTGTHPKWLIGLRNVTGSSTPSQTVQPAQPVNDVALVSSTSAAITFRVPVSSYSIVVAAEHPCWLVVKSPANASSSLVAMTLLPSSSPMSIAIHGSASISVAAQVRSITITQGSKVLHTIDAPVLGIAYTFAPSNT